MKIREKTGKRESSLLTFDAWVVEDVADGHLDSLEGWLEESPHGVSRQTQHALSRPQNVLVAKLTNS